jgi:hypothetical protein
MRSLNSSIDFIDYQKVWIMCDFPGQPFGRDLAWIKTAKPLSEQHFDEVANGFCF